VTITSGCNSVNPSPKPVLGWHQHLSTARRCVDRCRLTSRVPANPGQRPQATIEAIAAIGLDASKFGSHAMRSGWTSTAAKNGASLWEMKEISRPKSTDVLAGYVREAELFQQHASVGTY
jgi:hypothetical protein